jgi:hypothetical protein
MELRLMNKERIKGKFLMMKKMKKISNKQKKVKMFRKMKKKTKEKNRIILSLMKNLR